MLTQKLSSDSDSQGLGRLVTPILIIASLFLAWRFLHPATTFAADGLDPTWDSAVQQSHNSNQPAVILFTADWCPACQSLHADTLSQANVRYELNANYIFIIVDLTSPTPAARQHAAKMGVSAIPTLIRYDRNGKETDRTHYLPPDDMLAWLRAGE